MSDFLDIHGVTVRCAELTMKHEPIGAGVTRAANATARANEVARKWKGTGKTIPVQLNDALFFNALLGRRFDHWTFDTDLYSDKGLLATSAGSSIVGASPTPKYGAGCLSLPTAKNFTATVDAVATQSNAGFTACFWLSPTSTSWTRYIVTRDYSGNQTVYANGVSGALPASLTCQMVTNGTQLQIANATGSTYGLDDVLYVAAYCPSTLVTGLDTFMQGAAWPTAPKLTVSGDFHVASLTMLAEPGEMTNIQGNLIDGNGRKSNLRQLPFDLYEV